MNCSVNFFVPIVMTGAPATVFEPPEPSSPPQPVSASASMTAAVRPASAAVRRRRIISGYGSPVASRHAGARAALGGGQGEPEGAPLAGAALGPDAAAVALDDPPADGEADARALVAAV